MVGKRPSASRFDAAIDSKIASHSAVSAGSDTDNVTDIPSDTSTETTTDMSPVKPNPIFARINRQDGRASTAFRSEKLVGLVTPDERAALDDWLSGARDAAGLARLTASDTIRELVGELVTSPELTQIVIERVIARSK